jgi:hypothetical protein
MTGAEQGGDSGLKPLGTIAQVIAMLADFNTGPDGAPEKSMGTKRLYGPGFVIELASSTDVVTQGMVSINDEDIALAVLFRMCRALKWRMTDIETGMSFG